ncbi:hypothetical protein UP10_16555 [Bradyrhizobium sp. LTSPM299]|nr:hypothetical protein UP10_16555 [Bradyrhizobium sp. LTSPM299]
MLSRTAITLMLAAVPWSASAVSAQTAQDEQLRHVISNLKACVRTHAPAAQAIGIQTIGDAVNYFVEVCNIPMPDLARIGALPPGIIRGTIAREWTALADMARPH